MKRDWLDILMRIFAVLLLILALAILVWCFVDLLVFDNF